MAKVVVIGGANVDVKGKATELYAAHTSNPGQVVTSVGGVGRNIAHNLALLGFETALVSAVGDDSYGRLILEETAKAGVDVSAVKRVPVASGVYLAILDATGELAGAVNDMSILSVLTKDDMDESILRQADFIVADCNLGVELLGWLVAFCANHGLPLLTEPVSLSKAMKLRSLSPQKVYAVTPNLDQLHALTGVKDIESAVTALHDMGFANVVIHCGRDGAVVSGESQPLTSIPRVDVGTLADVTGAGDAAVAGLVCGLLEGLGLLEAARLGQAAAACKIGATSSVAPALSRDRLHEIVKVNSVRP